MLGKLKTLRPASLLKRSKGKDKIDYLVGLDIGTEYVKALIARVSGDKLEVIGVGREHQSLSDMQAGAVADITGVVKNCDRALSMAEEAAGVSVRTAVIGIAGELVKGTTTSVRVLRKDSTKELDIEEVERIIGLVQDRAQAKAVQQLQAEMGGKSVELRLVNSALVRIDIDGYQVTNPIGFTGKEMVVQLYTAFAPMIHISALERVAGELDLDLLAVAAEPFAVARSVIGNDANKNIDAILMDVGGGTTDIAVIKDGGVQGTQMFGIGGRAYTHAIERDSGLSFSRSEELKMALGTSNLTSDQQKKIMDPLQKTLDVWISGVELSLEEFTGLDSLPNKILLCGGGSSLGMLFDKLDQSNWYRSAAFSKKPVIEHIDPNDVVGVVDTTGKVTDHTMITAMGLLRVGLDTLQMQAGETSGSVRQKIDRMLNV